MTDQFSDFATERRREDQTNVAKSLVQQVVDLKKRLVLVEGMIARDDIEIKTTAGDYGAGNSWDGRRVYNSNDFTYKIFYNGAWHSLSVGPANAILDDGTVTWVANQSHGDFDITNVGDISLDSLSSDTNTTVDATDGWQFSGDITPAQIVADEDDYNPANLASASTLRLSTNAAWSITGLQGGSDGRILIIHNIGANDLTLTDEDVASAAANRFALTDDITLEDDGMTILQYDTTSSRWRAMSQNLGTGGGITWNEVVGVAQAAAVDNGYICNNAALVTVTLPNVAALGSIVRIAGKGAGGWRVAQNAGETIHYGSLSTTAGAGGSLDSSLQYDAVELLCITADTTWVVLSSIGNLQVI